MRISRICPTAQDQLHQSLQRCVDPEDLDLQNPLGFLDASTVSLPEVAYRFCRDEPGVHVVLSGTGNPEHVAANVASFDRPPLPEAGV